jgi:trehalose/maltose hydrolase-like predicted phosphorylase
MLEYRIRRLPEARRMAAACGRQGARFPWESAGGGGDVTPTSGVNELGETVPIRTGSLEEHITADVAWAAWHFASVTGAWGFLEGPGRALLLDTARYWASRVRFDWDGRAHIEGVIGPDEYHEDVDDNAYTNVMAAWNLRRAADLVEHSTQWVAAENAEVERWRTVADALVTGYDVLSGRHRQFEGYEELELLLAAELGGVPVAADVVLGERLHTSQIIKQADVVMLHHLVPDELPTGSLERDLSFYLPRTAHGSSLSPAVYAAVLARAGRVEEAANLLDVARRIDLDDLTGTTSGGLHIAAMGGMWQAVVHGFGGLRVTSPSDRALALDPRLPQGWEELRFRIAWHGHRVVVRARHDAVHIATDHPVPVTVSGQPITVVSPPGAWVPLDPASASRRGGGIAKEVPA